MPLPKSFTVGELVFTFEQSDEPMLEDDQYSATLPSGIEVKIQICASQHPRVFCPNVWNGKTLTYFGAEDGYRTFKAARAAVEEWIAQNPTAFEARS